MNKLRVPFSSMIAILSHEFSIHRAHMIRIGERGKTVRILLAFLIVTGLLFTSGCTGWAQKRERALKMVGSDSEQVKKLVGEPNIVTRNPENSVIWIYRPPYKLIPNEEGSVYLEFQDGKVAKAFSLK